MSKLDDVLNKWRKTGTGPDTSDGTSKLNGLSDTLFASAAKAFEPVLQRQLDILWPKIDAKIDQLVPQIMAAVLPALVKVLEAQIPKITNAIVDKLMDHLPQIIEGAIRAVVPDVLEKSFPVNKLADEITRRLRDALGGLGGLIPGFGR